MHTKRLRAKGVTLSYTVEPGDPWIIYLHGSGANLTVWKTYRSYFRGLGYGQIAVDMRGDGRSSMLPDPSEYTLEGYREDLRAIMDEQGIKRAILMGHSLGGLVALDFARSEPERVISACVFSTSANIKKSFAKSRLRRCIMDYPRIASLLPLAVNLVGGLFNYDRHKYYPDFTELAQRPDWLIGMTLWWNCSNLQLRSVLSQGPTREWDLTKELGKIRAPILIVHAKDDRLIQVGTADSLSSSLPNSEKLVLERGGHLVQVRGADEILPRMERFLKRHSKRS